MVLFRSNMYSARWLFGFLLTLRHQLEVLIEIIPLIILTGLGRRRLNLGLLGQIKQLRGILGGDVAVILRQTGLVVVDLAGVLHATDQIDPVLVALRDDLVDDVGRALVRLANDGDHLVAPRDLVVREPVAERLREARAVLLDVLPGVDEVGDGVLDVDHEHLPVGLAAVVGREAAENLDLLDLTDVADVLADVEEVDWVVVAEFVGEFVLQVGVFPGLRDAAVDEGVGLVREDGLDEAG